MPAEGAAYAESQAHDLFDHFPGDLNSANSVAALILLGLVGVWALDYIGFRAMVAVGK